MSHLTRFDSEMHEDEDDLEEVAAPIGDQQVSYLRFVSQPYFLWFDIENLFWQFLFLQGKKSVSVDDLNDALMEETTDESEAEGQLDLMMRLLLMKLLLLVVVILMLILVLLLMLMLTLLLILILKLVLLMLKIIFDCWCCNFNLAGAAVPIPEKEEYVPESSSNAGKNKIVSWTLNICL